METSIVYYNITHLPDGRFIFNSEMFSKYNPFNQTITTKNYKSVIIQNIKVIFRILPNLKIIVIDFYHVHKY